MDTPFLDSTRWERLSRLLDDALDLPPDRISSYLDASCPDDPELRAAAEKVLRAAATPPGVLDLPAILHVDPEGAAAPGLLQPGDRVGSFRIREEIGRGGMGVIYGGDRADGVFEQRVAVKVMKRGLDTDEILARFVQERRILARLEHPHIARILEGGATAQGLPYLAMEYVDGEPITKFGDRMGISLEEALRLFLQVCRA